MLYDLLHMLIEGSRQALRVRTEGRSRARGTPPRWITAATEFTVQIKEGSTLLEIEGPSLREADPEQFRQEELFRAIDADRPAVDFLMSSLEAAVEGETRSTEYDKQMLRFLRGFTGVFGHGIDRIEFVSNGELNAKSLYVEPATVSRLQEMEAKIPPPQHVNVTGRLNVIRYSDHMFELEVGGDRIKGIAEHEDLIAMWGKEVFVSGTAYFTATGLIQRIDADVIRAATQEELTLFDVAPTPIGAPLEVQHMSRSQGPRSGLSAIFGKWPGDETDDQILAELDHLS